MQYNFDINNFTNPLQKKMDFLGQFLLKADFKYKLVINIEKLEYRTKNRWLTSI